jgi:4'-phosphopantetheinyl transferase
MHRSALHTPSLRPCPKTLVHDFAAFSNRVAAAHGRRGYLSRWNAAFYGPWQGSHAKIVRVGRAFEPIRGQQMFEAANQLYVGLLDEVDRPSTYEACIAILSADERQRADRFVLERHRRQFVLAHGLVRAALSRHVPAIEPAAWTFRADRYGRPHVVDNGTNAPIHFSLSHTEGCVACVISSSECVGVDVEATDLACSHLAIAEFTFSPAETAALRALPPCQQKERFFDYWTLKEAYIKARGMGLHLPLDRFSMLVDPGTEIGISFTRGFDDVATRWRFAIMSPSSRTRLAVADGGCHNRPLRIATQSWPFP